MAQEPLYPGRLGASAPAYRRVGDRPKGAPLPMGGIASVALATPAKPKLAPRPFASPLKLALAAAFAALSLAAMGVRDNAFAQEQSAVREAAGTSNHLQVTRNKSRTFEVTLPFASAVVGSPDIADVLPMSDRILYVQGKKVGTTNVSIFDKNKKIIAILDVDVTIDVRAVTAKIRANTNCKSITVSSSMDQLILGGHVKSAADADQAVAIAKAALSDDKTTDAKAADAKLINLIKVDSPQQVLLKVRFIEASRTAERDLGFSWFAADPKSKNGLNFGQGLGAGPSVTSGIPIFGGPQTIQGSTPFAVGLATLASKGVNIDLLITALESKGLARRLAEPDLVALSGDTASFLAGGEVPIPVVQPSAGATALITMDYKPFGVQLTFMPTVLADGVINLRLAPSVSELDWGNQIQIAGYAIPALTKREARTTIELRDGQSFAIAGLLQTDGLRNIQQVPWVGSLPVLGSLFRSSGYQQKETDLVVIVTPRLAAPAALGQQLATPFDSRLPSNDTDFFLLGEQEVPRQFTEFVNGGGGMAGPYGHALPGSGQ